jgi:hypothetical protein
VRASHSSRALSAPIVCTTIVPPFVGLLPPGREALSPTTLIFSGHTNCCPRGLPRQFGEIVPELGGIDGRPASSERHLVRHAAQLSVGRQNSGDILDLPGARPNELGLCPAALIGLEPHRTDRHKLISSTSMFAVHLYEWPLYPTRS